VAPAEPIVEEFETGPYLVESWTASGTDAPERVSPEWCEYYLAGQI